MEGSSLNLAERHSRYNNYDLLRIISTMAVIFIHVNYHYFQYHAYEPSASIVYIIESLINIVTRFSVPAFVMISGAFNLRNTKNSDTGSFYRKTSWKIFLPVLGAIVLFLIIDESTAIVMGTSKRSPVIGIIKGSYYNLWFLYMLAGLYLLTPFIIKLKSVLSENAYKTISIFLMIWAAGSQAVSSEQVAYAIGVVFAFLGYYMLGDVILNTICVKRTSRCFFITAAFMYLLTFVVRYLGIEYYLFNAYTNFFSPFLVVASICVFTGFKQIDIKKDFSWLSGKTFYLYVFHSVTYSTIFKIIKIMGDAKEIWEIPAIIFVSIATFFAALGIAVAYDKFWKSQTKWRSKWYSLKLWTDLSAL